MLEDERAQIVESRMVPTEGLAVCLIDMQTVHVMRLDSAVLYRLIQNQIKIIRVCAELDLPLFVLEADKYGPTLDELAQEIRKVKRCERIIKFYNDGFEGDILHDRLQVFGIKNFFATGINASYCVHETSRSAVDRGYNLYSADRAIADCNCASCRTFEKKRAWYRRSGVFFPDNFGFQGREILSLEEV